MRPILALGMLVLLAAPAGASAQCPDGTPPPCGPAQPRLTRIQVLGFAAAAGALPDAPAL